MSKEYFAKLDGKNGKAAVWATPTYLGGPLKCDGWFELEESSMRDDVGWRLLDGLTYEGAIELPYGEGVIVSTIKVTLPIDESYNPSDTIFSITGELDLSQVPIG